MSSNSRILNTISVSFENDHVPNSCSVEINLQPNSPIRDESVEVLPVQQQQESAVADDDGGGETDAVEYHRNGLILFQPPSVESRNDDSESQVAISPPAAARGIFRRNNSNPENGGTTTTPMAPHHDDDKSDDGPRNQTPADDPQTTKSTSDTPSSSLLLPPPILTDHHRRTFKSSVSYDGLFEVRKSRSSRQGVTTLAGAQSINLLYDELRQISSASIAQADEALHKESSFVGIAGTPNTSRRLSLLSRADEMILEARKACASYHNSIVDNENSSLADDEDDHHPHRHQGRLLSSSSSSQTIKTNKDPWSNHREFLHQRIKRTQSLDRVLSTKEVLDLATQALQQKEKGKPRKDDHTGINSETQQLWETSDYTADYTTTASTSEQEAMLGRQAELGSLSPQDKRLRDTLLRIQASNLSKTFSNASENTLLDDLQEENTPPTFPSFIPEETNPARDKALKRLDGIKDTNSTASENDDDDDEDDDDAGSIRETKQALSKITLQKKGRKATKRGQKETAAFSLMRYLWGGDEDEDGHKGIALACGTRRQLNEELRESGKSPYENKFASMATSLMRRNHRHHHHELRFPSYPETIANRPKADSRMRDWIDGQFAPKDELPLDGSYLLGKSRTVVVHEVVRGNWTWCTAWSPDGSKLAIATETHHLAIVDTSTSVWRVTHDKRIAGPVKNDTTHSIRSIAWGAHFIAIGGTGNAVSILAPSEPYPILHTIKGTGFVGSLDWRIDSTVLAIGSRCNKAMIMALSAGDDAGRQLQSEILETITRKNWVNAVAFSPGGLFFAVGDSGGQLSIFRWVERRGSQPTVKPVTSFQMEDAILALSFSPDGKWLYSGGEDMRVTIISSNHWEIVHRLRRNRWVQCVSASRGGTHVCCGGVSSEVSILEVGLGWDTVINIELKGLVPLSACWHPRDQFLALTGQNHSILVVETTNARHVSGHFLRSISPVLAVEFSPDGRHAVIGNQQGVITFFKLQGAAFIIAYEMVVTIGDTLCIRWSPDGSFIAIGSQNLLLIVGKTKQTDGSNRPEHSSGFSITKVMRGMGDIKAVAISALGRYIVACGTKMEVLDVSSSYKSIRSFEHSGLKANGWSADGRWLATIGDSKILTIYDTDFNDCDRWRVVVSLEGTHTGLAVAFGPISGNGLVYVAFGGDDKCVTVVEIRTNEGTWETVLRAQRDGKIHDLDWNADGLLAAAIGNGTVSIIDLSYLRAGLAVNEMDYKAQRQALTCFTEIRRNRGRNSMKTVKWIPCNGKGSPSMLAVGGTDGEVEIIDLTSRDKCHGYTTAG